MRYSSERAERFITLVRTRRDVAVASGYEGLAGQMQAYPTFSPQETDLAVRVYRAGLSVSRLAEVSPFREQLAVEQVQRQMRTPSLQQASYSLLFSEKRQDGTPVSIPELISLAHHDVVLRWISAFDAMFRDLALPLDEFYNHALSTLLPNEVATYNPDIAPESFRSWASRMLFWRLHGLAQKRARELRSLPAEMRPTHHTAFKDSSRRTIVSLDMPVPGRDGQTPVSVADLLEDPRQQPELPLETTTGIAVLFRMAGLTPQEAEAFIRTSVYDETSEEAGASMGRSGRSVRNYRESAVKKLFALGDVKTVAAIMRGDIEKVGASQESASAIPTQEAQPEQQKTSVSSEARETPKATKTKDAKERSAMLPCLSCGKDVAQPSRKQSK